MCGSLWDGMELAVDHFYVLCPLWSGIYSARPGSPFLASEDRVLGGVIVLRCCRCVESPSSKNIQGILGKSASFSFLTTVCSGGPRSDCWYLEIPNQIDEAGRKESLLSQQVVLVFNCTIRLWFHMFTSSDLPVWHQQLIFTQVGEFLSYRSSLCGHFSS